MLSDTVIAPATPPGYGGVSLVRISGPKSEEIAKSLAKKTKPFKDRVATLSSIYNSRNEKIDDAIITYFKTPSSYTGENVIEISCHGNPIIVDQIITSVCNMGARIAEPGEFTKRAFLNGKLDLVQAESVAAIIKSQSTEAARINHKILSGDLSNKLREIKDSVLSVLAKLEFEFDISENELTQPNLIKNTVNTINNSRLSCSSLIDSYEEGRIVNKGARVVIYGEPNVGKSTLLNALLEKDRAITSETPGTTRDTVDAQIVLGGVPVTLIDTAGLRNSNNTLEAAGVERSRSEIKNADLLINVVTLGEKVKKSAGFGKEITVYNKSDIIDYPKKDGDTINISALMGHGLGELKNLIKNKLIIKNESGSSLVLTTRRQVMAISHCKDSLVAALKHLGNSAPELELVSFELRDAINQIDTLLGKTTADDILNKVFSGFCVGK